MGQRIAAAKTWAEYPLCDCGQPFAAIIAPKRDVFRDAARGGRLLCHVCNGRVSLAHDAAIRVARRSGETVNHP